jgi:hypothetical protein
MSETIDTFETMNYYNIVFNNTKPDNTESEYTKLETMGDPDYKAVRSYITLFSSTNEGMSNGMCRPSAARSIVEAWSWGEMASLMDGSSVACVGVLRLINELEMDIARITGDGSGVGVLRSTIELKMDFARITGDVRSVSD